MDAMHDMQASDLIVRAGDANDFHSCVPLIEKNYGQSVVTSPLFQNQELFDLYAENVIAVIAQNARGILGGLSVVQIQDWDGTTVSELCRPFIDDNTNSAVIRLMMETAAISFSQGSFWCMFDCFGPLPWQEAAESCGFRPAGWYPNIFLLHERTSVIAYHWMHPQARGHRRPAPELIPEIEPLARLVLASFEIPFDATLREDAVSYPSHASLVWEELDYVSVAKYLQTIPATPAEVLVLLQDTVTPFKMQAERFRFFGARQAGQIVGIIGCNHDTQQQTATLTHLYASVPATKGWLCRKLVEESAGWHTAAIQTTLSGFSPRIQKTFADLGFIPAAYLPAFFVEGEQRLDAIKMIKLLGPCNDHHQPLTPAAGNLRSLLEERFKTCELGLPILHLLKSLHGFRGLGDGELLHLMEASTQKFYRQGERVFQEGETQLEMYVVIRGEVHLSVTAAGDRVLDRLKKGSIFGELAFLNGKPRAATATASADSLLLVLHRDSFDRLVDREQHLGLMVFHNIATDLSEKLQARTARLFHR